MAIGVAILGSGIFAREEHLPAVKAAPNLALKAIYSRSLKSAQALSEAAGAAVDLYSNDAGTGRTYHDLLLRPDVQAVIVALPIANQPEFIEAALKAGKHVLSEKPIAENTKDAEHLIKFYNSQIDKKVATWGVAENFRFLDSFSHAAEQVEKLGRILSFGFKLHVNVQPGDKWYETEWRKTPTHQGGFLLDGGVHFVAGVRLLLGSSASPVSVSAYTTLLQPHLPPVDTVNSIWLTKSGTSGTFSLSFGAAIFSGAEYNVACEKGTVTIAGDKVTIQEVGGKTAKMEFPDQGSGVKQEVAAWAEGLAAGRPNPRQSPEEAMADLHILEKMLKSGEGQGKTETLQLPI